VCDAITDDTVVIIGSAGNYPYGTIDPIESLSQLAVERGVGCTWTALGGWILPWDRISATPTSPSSTSACGVTSFSATRTSTATDSRAPRCSPGETRPGAVTTTTCARLEGRRLRFAGPRRQSLGGLIAATWASMMRLGRQGYRERARRIFDTAFAMQTAVKRHASFA